MGGRIAGRLLASGHRVLGTNRTAANARPLRERGLVWCDTPRAVAQEAEVIVTMVTDDAALSQVTGGPDGILPGLKPGKTYVDMSTVSPGLSRELAEQVRARGAEMLDAPVSGSLPAAEDGTLTIMVGGREAAFARVQPILSELGTRVVRIGENGSALLMKLAVNISLAVQMLAFSESVLLAEKGGIDRGLAVSVLTQSAIGSPMLKGRAPLVLDLPEQALFAVSLMRKDLDLALRAASALDVPLPSAAIAEQLYTAARVKGYAHRDIAAIYQVLSGNAGRR
jgi:3-hydroxyisobutyrate dehydrogenase-like beta-hydroxyacid dehydrogenase